MVLTSESSKQVVLVELTVSWEDQIEVAYKRKKAKYLELVEACGLNDWRADCEPINVGYRGFPAQSLHQTLRLLGIRWLQERKATKYWLWIKRGDTWCSALLGQKSGTDQPWLSHSGEGV